MQQEQMSQGYPANEEEGARAEANAVKVVHSEAVQPLIVEALQGDNRVQDIAGVVAKVLQMLVTSVHEKTNRKPKLSSVVSLAKVVLEEIAIIAQHMGINMPQQELQQAGQLAGQIIQETFSNTPRGGMQGQQQVSQQVPQQPQHPQGLIGGQMNAVR